MDKIICPNGCCTIKIKPYKQQNKIYYKIPTRRRKAGVFIYDPNTDKVLLIQSRGNLWGAPKGTLHYGETERKCAIREVKEETGLDISYDDFTKATKIHNNSIYFYLEMNECDVTVQDHIYDNDANGIGWIKINCLEKFIENGNININKHCRIIFAKFKKKYFPYSKFIQVKTKRKYNRLN